VSDQDRKYKDIMERSSLTNGPQFGPKVEAVVRQSKHYDAPSDFTKTTLQEKDVK
jgi:hypothetical protein